MPLEPPFPVAAGNHQKVSLPVTGLEAGTTYWVCLLAINPAEEAEQTFGSTVEFTTPASKPLVASESAVGVTPFAATLVAEVNPENESSSCVFEYGPIAASEYRVPCEPASVEGGGPVGVSVALGKLSPASRYHYRVVVKNATGETEGPEESFETLALEKPIVEGEHTGLLTAPQTTIEAALNPNYQPVTGCEIQYVLEGAGFGTPQSVPCEANNPPENSFGEGASPVPLIATLSGLTPGASYEYRILATNNSGTFEGPAQTFALPPAPLLTVGEAQSITRTTATLPGTVNPEGLETFYYYEYGTSTSYGGNAPSAQGVSAGSGLEALPATIGISGLVPATTYHYRLVAVSADGTTPSTDQTFTTAPATPPTASTGEASNVTLTSATVAGTINPEGLETSYELDLGTDTTYGTSLYGEAGSASTPAKVTVNLQDLAPGGTYHYRIVAINSDGRTYGTDRTFTTPAYSNPIVQPFLHRSSPPRPPRPPPPPKPPTPPQTPTKPKKTKNQQKKKNKKNNKKLHHNTPTTHRSRLMSRGI